MRFLSLILLERGEIVLHNGIHITVDLEVLCFGALKKGKLYVTAQCTKVRKQTIIAEVWSLFHALIAHLHCKYFF